MKIVILDFGSDTIFIHEWSGTGQEAEHWIEDNYSIGHIEWMAGHFDLAPGTYENLK